MLHAIIAPWHGMVNRKTRKSVQELSLRLLLINYCGFSIKVLWPLVKVEHWDGSPLYKSLISKNFITKVSFEFELGEELFSKLCALSDGIYVNMKRPVYPQSEQIGDEPMI